MNIAQHSVVVTGGASGLGAATARLLAARGAEITLFDLNSELGEPLAAEIRGRFQLVDVTDELSVLAGLDTATDVHGTARILVNCAGIAPAIKAVDSGFDTHPIGTFRKAVEINLVGTFLVASPFAAQLQQAEAIARSAAPSSTRPSPPMNARSGRLPMPLPKQTNKTMENFPFPSKSKLYFIMGVENEIH